MEARITGRTKLYGLIGSPVGHSGSPAMLNYSFKKLDIDAAYLAFDIPAEKAGEAIAAMKTFQMRGMNVTMPCKTAVVPYMDDLSPASRIIGAVNTIVNDDGKLTGHITDGEGFVKNLSENGVTVKGKKMVILGAGGAATAIYVQCALDGAKEIAIFNVKDPFFDRAVETSKKVIEEAPECHINVYDLEDTQQLKAAIEAADILVNGTLVGMKPNEESSPVKDPSMLKSGLVVADVVYNPRETKLLKEAKAAGCQCINGTGMLLWQGAAAFKLWTGQEMPAKEVQKLFFS